MLDGRLRIPNAALEPVKWSDLGGWAGDDHARAFATFYASCRPIVRASALRAEAVEIHRPPAKPKPSQAARATLHPVEPPPASGSHRRSGGAGGGCSSKAIRQRAAVPFFLLTLMKRRK